jgi:ADP-ribose pyrophosphatase YjhB (NUDIX family)
LDKRRIANLVRSAPWLWSFAQQVYRFVAPRVTIGAVGAVFNANGHILLVEHVFHPLFPWGMPGGWMNRNEEPGETVRREILEETGLRVEVVKPLLITLTPSISSHLDVSFLCRLAPGVDENDIHLSEELLAYRWYDPLEVPPLVYFHRKVMQAALAELKASLPG